jgi:hypothetical protein
MATARVLVGPGFGPDRPRSGLDCFLFSKFHFLSNGTINRSFFISYKSYRLLEPIQNIGFQPIPQILFVVVPRPMKAVVCGHHAVASNFLLTKTLPSPTFIFYYAFKQAKASKGWYNYPSASVASVRNSAWVEATAKAKGILRVIK